MIIGELQRAKEHQAEVGRFLPGSTPAGAADHFQRIVDELRWLDANLSDLATALP